MAFVLRTNFFEKTIRKSTVIASTMMIGTAILAATIAVVIFGPVTVPLGVALGASITLATLSSSCVGVGVLGIIIRISPNLEKKECLTN
jgi:hypothetical protein